MCRIDGVDNTNDFERIENRCARISHRCSECRRDILPGERYRREMAVDKDRGHCDTFKYCGHCAVAYQWLSYNCGGYVYNEAIADLREHAREYPTLAIPLNRMVVAARRKWQKFGGGLMPIPNLPPDLDFTH